MKKYPLLITVSSAATWPAVAAASDFGSLAMELMMMAAAFALLFCAPVLNALANTAHISDRTYIVSALLSVSAMIIAGSLLASEHDALSDGSIFAWSCLVLLFLTLLAFIKLTHRYKTQP